MTMKFSSMLKHSIGKALIAVLLSVGIMAAAAPSARAAVFVRVGFAPPPIPIYDQPLIPGDGYMWTPGYWAWDGSQYYWVDGAWVYPPYMGALWTPGFWGWGGGFYFWHPGYWGRTVGYYGGINYGFGYFGTGFYGGYWGSGHFFYNSAYAHVGPGFHNVYNRPTGGFGPHPGGESFAHNGGNFAGNRTAGINGHEAVGGQGFAGNNARPAVNTGGMAARPSGGTEGGFHGGAPAGGFSGGGHVSSGGGGGHAGGGGGHR